MVLRITPEQVSEGWKIIGRCIEESLLPFIDISGDGMTNILKSIMLEYLEVWAYIDDASGNVHAIVTTSIETDRHTGNKNLLIYSLYGVREVRNEMFQEGIEFFLDYAESEGCSSVIAYSNVGGIVKVARRKGAKTDFQLLEWEV